MLNLAQLGTVWNMPNEPAGVEIAGTPLRQLRKITGLGMGEFADAVEISYGYLSQIERGHAKVISPALFNRICNRLELFELDDRRQLIRSTPVAA